MKRIYTHILLMLMVVPLSVLADTGWRPHPGPQEHVLTRREFEVLYGGARGGGKTDAGLAWMAEPEYIANPRYQGLVVRRNAGDLSDWINRARHFYRPYGGKISGNPPIIRFPSGAIIRTGHLKDEGAYTKYQGHEYQHMLIEEITQIPREKDYEMLISSCRSTIPGLPAQVFATTNPGGAGHVWVKARWVDVARCKAYWPDIVMPDKSVVRGRSRIFIPSRIDDNPTLMERDPYYVLQIESIKDEKLRNAWRWGDWDTFSGQFFDKWSTEKHVIKPFRIPPQWYHIRAMDWGRTAPAAVLWIAVDYQGRHYVYRELKKAGLEPSQLAKKVLRMTGEHENIVDTIADPSIWIKNQHGSSRFPEQATTKSIAGLMEEAGLFCSAGNNDRISGWANMKELMYWDKNIDPRLYVFDNCTDFINDIPSMVHDEKNVEDCDTDGDDHIGDACRYGLLHTVPAVKPSEPPDPIENLIEKITETPDDGYDGADEDWDDA